MQNSANHTICNMTEKALHTVLTVYFGDRYHLLKSLDLISIVFTVYGCYRLRKPSWQNRPDRIHILGQFLATFGFHCTSLFMIFFKLSGSKTTWSILNKMSLASAAFRHHMQLSTILTVVYNTKRLFRNDRTLLVELRLESDSGNLLNHPTELLSQFFAAGAITVISATVGSANGVIRRWVAKDESYLNKSFGEAMRSLLALLVVFELLPLLLLTVSSVVLSVALWKLKTHQSRGSTNKDIISERQRVSKVALKLCLVYALKYLPLVAHYSLVTFYGNLADTNACGMFRYVFDNGSKASQRNIGPYSH